MEFIFILGISLAMLLGCLIGLVIEFCITHSQIKALENENRILSLKLKESNKQSGFEFVEIVDRRSATGDYFKPF